MISICIGKSECTWHTSARQTHLLLKCRHVSDQVTRNIHCHCSSLLIRFSLRVLPWQVKKVPRLGFSNYSVNRNHAGEFGKTHNFWGFHLHCWYNEAWVRIPYFAFIWDNADTAVLGHFKSHPPHLCPHVCLCPHSPSLQLATSSPFVGPLSISTYPCLYLRLEPFCPKLEPFAQMFSMVSTLAADFFKYHSKTFSLLA